MEVTIPVIKTNRFAIISLVTAILAPISYCAASALIATTSLDEASRPDALNIGMYGVGFFFYAIAPLALTITALICGKKALGKIKQTSERGKGLAISGMVIGGLVIAANICLIVSIIGIGLAGIFNLSR